LIPISFRNAAELAKKGHFHYAGNMKQDNSIWYLVLLIVVIVTAVVTNELGIGVITFAPLTLLAYWLISKVFEKDSPSN
jgi:membrane protein implicated in regulation of membrane protease activity